MKDYSKALASCATLACFLVITLLPSCKPEGIVNPTPKPIDTCLALKPTNADFDIVEDVRYQKSLDKWIDYACDTVVYNKVYFQAKDTTCNSYTWRIGRDTLYGKKVRLNFGSRPRFDDNITISLSVVKNKPNRICFPQDSGIASFSKQLILRDEKWANPYFETSNNPAFCYCKGTNMAGKYKGADTDSPLDTHIVTIRVCELKSDTSNLIGNDRYYRPTINNLDKGYDIFDFATGGKSTIGFKQMTIGYQLGALRSTSGYGFYGIFRLSKNSDTLHSTYTVGNRTLVTKTFIGVRID